MLENRSARYALRNCLPRSRRRITMASLVGVLCVIAETAGGAAPASAAAWYGVAWPDFSSDPVCVMVSFDQRNCGLGQDNPLPDGDHVFLKKTDGLGIAPSDVEVRLTTPSAITWWKSVKAVDAAGVIVASVATQDASHGPVTFRVSTTSARALVLSKAKTFGWHTDMYQVGNLAAVAGKRVTFDWRVD